MQDIMHLSSIHPDLLQDREGGRFCLIDNPDALSNEFEDAVKTNGENDHDDFHHHDHSPAVQSAFQDDVKFLC